MRVFYTGSINHVGEGKNPSDVSENQKMKQFIPTSINHTKVRFSGHHLKWSWTWQGTTYRHPDKEIRLGRGDGWLKRIYHFKGATIILNKNIMEVWIKSKPYKTVERMIAAKSDKADLIARSFSKFAQIAIQPIKTDHPDNIGKAHLVLTTKKLNPVLKPMSAVKDDVGLIFDKSHPNLPELVGSESVEGAVGAQWFFTRFPNDFSLFMQTMVEYKEQLKLHLEVERETLRTMKAIRKNLEEKP